MKPSSKKGWGIFNFSQVKATQILWVNEVAE